MLISGREMSVAVEKPAAGGRMIARHEGQIVLVAGRDSRRAVNVTIDRVEKRLAFASTTSIVEPSPDRREAARSSVRRMLSTRTSPTRVRSP